MANSNYVIRISVPGPNPVVSGNKRLTLRNLARMIMAMGAGSRPGSGNNTLKTEDTAVAASGTLTISSGSGTVGGTINGVSVTVTWATSDTNTGDLLAAAINASGNALVNKAVTATNAAGVVTVTSSKPGVSGNWVMLAASGTGVTASAARLTGGSSTDNSYSF